MNFPAHGRTAHKELRAGWSACGSRTRPAAHSLLAALGSLFCEKNTLFSQKKSLFAFTGNLSISGCKFVHIFGLTFKLEPKSRKFPDIFPDNREFASQTGSPLTASSASY
jgi:hypothetical protein